GRETSRRETSRTPSRRHVWPRRATAKALAPTRISSRYGCQRRTRQMSSWASSGIVRWDLPSARLRAGERVGRDGDGRRPSRAPPGLGTSTIRQSQGMPSVVTGWPLVERRPCGSVEHPRVGGELALLAQADRSQGRRDGAPPRREQRPGDEREDMGEGRAGEGSSKGTQDAQQQGRWAIRTHATPPCGRHRNSLAYPVTVPETGPKSRYTILLANSSQSPFLDHGTSPDAADSPHRE